MRDGNGNTLSDEEVAKVKAVETGKSDTSVNITSIDPKVEPKPAAQSDDSLDNGLVKRPAHIS
jgi:hypothetical protein